MPATVAAKLYDRVQSSLFELKLFTGYQVMPTSMSNAGESIHFRVELPVYVLSLSKSLLRPDNAHPDCSTAFTIFKDGFEARLCTVCASVDLEAMSLDIVGQKL